jgi:hypothetical protein
MQMKYKLQDRRAFALKLTYFSEMLELALASAVEISGKYSVFIPPLFISSFPPSCIHLLFVCVSFFLIID